MNYTVNVNETLPEIAQNFGVSVDDLISYNNLSPTTRLFPGMIIIIPPTRPRPPLQRTYTVRRGDTIYSISRMFGVSVRSIMNRNNLLFPIVFPGQRLIIPIRPRPY